ncbi:ABC transporter permease [Corynebacterium suedekumii]|uniref:ABC transporter permease n=1 Tax=Corynebacterium suedekumii TaxID=3049801 RepID=A0ABY8VLW6_9CORY|nr:ABC transporter permease [Corynebacterium suedekumii]WIM70650.1 ABC transporter permease [Corynebacterium suedekumii]
MPEFLRADVLHTNRWGRALGLRWLRFGRLVHPRNNRGRLLVLVSVAFLLILGIALASGLYPQSAIQPTGGQRNLPPSWQFPLGTDWVGRDLAARTMKGMWLSIRIGALTALVSTAVSVLFAVLATAGSRWLDRIVSWLVDATIGLPQIVLAILIAFAVGGGTRGVVLAVGLTLWPPLTRLLRAEILKLKEEPFVAMSRAQGHGSAWVIRHHLLPALTPHILVGLAIMFPHAILHESTLTFLGFGIEPTTPSLGIILAEGMRYLSNGQWWAVLGPIAVLVTLATVLDACGDLLRSLLAPVSRHQ